jgi:dTDP-4-amino-4,6-dideoxygalactose transaminase
MMLPEANFAFGREQLKRMDWIVAERKKNHDAILAALPNGEFEPVSVHKLSTPSWFGVILKPKHVRRNALGDALEHRGIRHRPFFAGNITRHDPYVAYTTPLPNADYLMERAMFIGCYAGLTTDQVDYVGRGVKLALSDCKDTIAA